MIAIGESDYGIFGSNALAQPGVTNKALLKTQIFVVTWTLLLQLKTDENVQNCRDDQFYTT